MSITLMYGCGHIELVVRDLDAACQFMKRVLSAKSIEQQFASDLRSLLPDEYDIDHLDCGQATFQFNQAPAPGVGSNRSVFQRYLDDVGPCVTDLNFYVDDIAHARELLTTRGAPTHMEGPSSIVRSLADYGPDNTRPGGATRPFLFMGSRPLIGFDLEMMEPNFVRFVDQTAQRPCFVRPGPRVEDLRLQRLSIAVHDLTETYTNLVELFTPGSRSAPYATGRDLSARSLRITLCGIELEYCEPLDTESPLARHLERYGPGVVTADFGAVALDPILDRIRADASLNINHCSESRGDAHLQPRWQISSRAIVGFDVVLEEVDAYALR